ncbi:MAG: hypothetical protein HY335_05730 [Deinococcus sp.]|nr:hypothetical protein [Deinococcus sp.]
MALIVVVVAIILITWQFPLQPAAQTSSVLSQSQQLPPATSSPSQGVAPSASRFTCQAADISTDSSQLSAQAIGGRLIWVIRLEAPELVLELGSGAINLGAEMTPELAMFTAEHQVDLLSVYMERPTSQVGTQWPVFTVLAEQAGQRYTLDWTALWLRGVVPRGRRIVAGPLPPAVTKAVGYIVLPNFNPSEPLAIELRTASCSSSGTFQIQQLGQP